MATLYLHLGVPKTGTTAIQNFLGYNAEALNAHKICFPDLGLRAPDVGRYRNANFLNRILWDVVNGRDTTNKRNTFQSMLKQLTELGRQYDTILLSDEALWRFSASYPKFWTDLKEVLAENGLQLRIIAYLRRQDNLALSFYREKVKSLRTALSFYDYMDTAMRDYPMDYLPSLNLLSDCIGKENIVLRVYEQEQYLGAEHNLLSDFLNIFGLSFADGFKEKKKKYNVTLDGSYLELRRIFNELPASCTSQTLRQGFRLILKDPDITPPERTSLFKSGEQAEYLASFSESNARIAREFLNREDGTLFYNTQDIELPEYKVSTDALLHDMILYYGQTIRLLEDEINDLHKEIETLRAGGRIFQENGFFSHTQQKIRHLFDRHETT